MYTKTIHCKIITQPLSKVVIFIIFFKTFIVNNIINKFNQKIIPEKELAFSGN